MPAADAMPARPGFIVTMYRPGTAPGRSAPTTRPVPVAAEAGIATAGPAATTAAVVTRVPRARMRMERGSAAAAPS
jgi:hypothetical protein